MTALLDEATRATLRSKAEMVEGLVERSVDECPDTDEELAARAERRWAWYRNVEDLLLDLVNLLPAGTEDYDARQLFVFLTELRRAIEADADVTDAAGSVQLAARKMVDVMRRMGRRLEHSVLEHPDDAARYLFAQLDAVSTADLAALLGVSARTVGHWRAGRPVKQNAERVMLVAQLVSYLRYTTTPTGLLMWFDNPSDLLGGRSPRELLDADGARAAWSALVGYARGGRAQLAG